MTNDGTEEADEEEEDKTCRRSRRQIMATAKADEARKEGAIGLPTPSLSSCPERSTSSLFKASSSHAVQPTKHNKMVRLRKASSITPLTTKSRGYTLPTFGPDSFFIYYWPAPIPQSFPGISDSYRAWKASRDVFERETDVDDGADNWHDFAGNSIDYGSTRSFLYTIAGSFLARAKRAFRGGFAWSTFEQLERQLESDSRAKMIEDPVQRQRWLKEMLNNDLRLAVFDIIAGRLCNEIWLEEYTVPALSQGKRDSKVESMGSRQGSVTIEPSDGGGVGIQSFDANGEERPKIKGWLRDQYGMWQPTYGDEVHLPSGVDDARRQSMEEQAARFSRVGAKPTKAVHGEGL